MDFIKIFDKIVAVDAIKCIETRCCDRVVEVCLTMKEGPELLIYKNYPKNADLNEYTNDVMSAIAKTFADLSDSDCEDIEDYLPYDEDDDYDDDEDDDDEEDDNSSNKIEYYTYYR